MNGPSKRLRASYAVREILRPAVVVGLFALGLLAIGAFFAADAKNSYQSHQVWLEGEPSEGTAIGTRSTSLLGAMSSYVVEVKYVDAQGQTHTRDELFSRYFEGLIEPAPFALRVSKSNPDLFATSGAEASWFRSMLADGAVAVLCIGLGLVLLALEIVYTRGKLARFGRMCAGRWVALPRELGDGSPDFTSVSGNGEFILGVQFDTDDGATEQLAVGADGAPFVLTPEALEQAITAARASR